MVELACSLLQGRARPSGEHTRHDDSPLAHRGKVNNVNQASRESSEDRHPHSAPGKPGQHSRTPSSISALSAVSATAANILYAPTADETIVNTFLILLLNALGTRYPAASAEWSINRLVMKHTFGSAGLEARTDGSLRMKDEGPVVAIVEVKPHLRSKNEVPIKMQETTQMVTWIAQEGFPVQPSRP